VLRIAASGVHVLKRVGVGLLWGVVGYVCGAFAGGWLVAQLSSNSFDRDMEAAMTGAFVIGPLAGCVAFAIGAWRARPRGVVS
jgi:hypothetical protein